MNSFYSFDLGDVAAVVSALTALFAIFVGGRIQIRLASSAYLRDIKEKRLIQTIGRVRKPVLPWCDRQECLSYWIWAGWDAHPTVSIKLDTVIPNSNGASIVIPNSIGNPD